MKEKITLKTATKAVGLCIKRIFFDATDKQLTGLKFSFLVGSPFL